MIIKASDLVKVDWRIIMAAIIALCIIESIALICGVNGVVLTAVVGAIAGLAGWTLPQLKTKDGS